MWSSSTPRAAAEASTAAACRGIHVLRLHLRRVVVFPNGDAEPVSWCAGECSRSPLSSFLGVEGGLQVVMLLCRSRPPSCGHAIAEDGDFPAAFIPAIRVKVPSVAPGGHIQVLHNKI